MTRTARLRLAVSLAAAIASATALTRVSADDQGPTSAGTTTRTATSPAGESPGAAPKRSTYPFRGVIATIDTTTRSIVLEGRQARRVIRLTETTRVEKLGRPAAFDDLKAGDAVRGTLRRTAQGHEEAVLVRAGPRGETPAPEEKAPGRESAP